MSAIGENEGKRQFYQVVAFVSYQKNNDEIMCYKYSSWGFTSMKKLNALTKGKRALNLKIRGVERKSPLRDSSYFKNLSFLKIFYFNYICHVFALLSITLLTVFSEE